MKIFTTTLTIGVLILISACAEVQVTTPGDDTTSDTKTDGTDTEMDTGDTEFVSDSETSAEEDSATETSPIPDTSSDTDTVAETDSETPTDTAPDTSTDTQMDTETVTATETDSAYDLDFSVFLNFKENIQFFPYYNSHRVLVGRASSQNPEDGSWMEVAGATAMKNISANDSWASVSLDATVQVSALGTGNIRLAFHYEGASADDWWLDDICVGKSNSSCELFALESFSGIVAGDLPTGWIDVEGADNQSSSHDWSVDLTTFDAQRAAGITFDNASISRYLLTPRISLP